MSADCFLNMYVAIKEYFILAKLCARESYSRQPFCDLKVSECSLTTSCYHTSSNPTLSAFCRNYQPATFKWLGLIGLLYFSNDHLRQGILLPIVCFYMTVIVLNNKFKFNNKCRSVFIGQKQFLNIYIFLSL